MRFLKATDPIRADLIALAYRHKYHRSAQQASKAAHSAKHRRFYRTNPLHVADKKLSELVFLLVPSWVCLNMWRTLSARGHAIAIPEEAVTASEKAAR